MTRRANLVGYVAFLATGAGFVAQLVADLARHAGHLVGNLVGVTLSAVCYVLVAEREDLQQRLNLRISTMQHRAEVAEAELARVRRIMHDGQR